MSTVAFARLRFGMDPIQAQPELLKEYNELVLEDLAAIEPVQIASVVSSSYVLDFLILYESLLESWTFYPFCLHAYTVDRETYERLSGLELKGAEMHLLREDSQSEQWAGNALAKIKLIELSGLDRCIVSDVDNVFLAETPELFMLLDRFDFVFVGSPVEPVIIQTSLWAFRRNERTVRFADRWYEHSRPRAYTDASGLPFALLEDREDLEIKVLARPRPQINRKFFLSPYDVQANMGPFVLRNDGLGFREVEMGRAKVLHLGGLRPKGDITVKGRIETLVERFPETVSAFPLYLRLANRAAARLGMETETVGYLRERAYSAGVLETRDDLPALLNDRGLVGRGAYVGVTRAPFSEQILRHWEGSLLISVYPDDDGLVEEAASRLRLFGERSSIWRSSSEEAVARIEPRSLDFVYLDLTEDQDSYKRELHLWYETIHKGGILAGDQYFYRDRRGGVVGVKRAVDEFAAEKEIKVNSTYADAPYRSWFVDVS
jgi:hypothetical protein